MHVRGLLPDLPSHGDVLFVLIARGPGLGVVVVECDGHAGFGDACLALLVHQLLEAGGPNLGRSKQYAVSRMAPSPHRFVHR
jgi:hypothetical protein